MRCIWDCEKMFLYFFAVPFFFCSAECDICIIPLRGMAPAAPDVFVALHRAT